MIFRGYVQILHLLKEELEHAKIWVASGISKEQFLLGTKELLGLELKGLEHRWCP